MKNKSLTLITAVVLSVVGGVGLLAERVGALECVTGDCSTEFAGAGAGKTVQKAVKNGITLFLGILGTLAIIMVIYGGFLYTTSAGDAAKVTKAKNTIMYGVIGLVVALLAYAIVTFVTSKIV